MNTKDKIKEILKHLLMLDDMTSPDIAVEVYAGKIESLVQEAVEENNRNLLKTIESEIDNLKFEFVEDMKLIEKGMFSLKESETYRTQFRALNNLYTQIVYLVIPPKQDKLLAQKEGGE